MNLVNALMHVLHGAALGFEQSRAERQRRVPSGHEFREHVNGLSRLSRIPVVGVTDQRATFQVLSGGRVYPVVVLNETPLRIGACSCITWRRGAVPPGVLATLARQNLQMDNLSFDLIEGENDAFIIIETTLSASEFTLEAFQSVLNQLVPRMVTLDDWLFEHGRT